MYALSQDFTTYTIKEDTGHVFYMRQGDWPHTALALMLSSNFDSWKMVLLLFVIVRLGTHSRALLRQGSEEGCEYFSKISRTLETFSASLT